MQLLHAERAIIEEAFQRTVRHRLVVRPHRLQQFFLLPTRQIAEIFAVHFRNAPIRSGPVSGRFFSLCVVNGRLNCAVRLFALSYPADGIIVGYCSVLEGFEINVLLIEQPTPVLCFRICAGGIRLADFLHCNAFQNGGAAAAARLCTVCKFFPHES